MVVCLRSTDAVWIPTEQTEAGWLRTRHSGKGSRRRGEEFRIHPNQIKQLGIGQAVVLTPGAGNPTIANMLHPMEAQR
jgi:hypothetical protein